MPQSKTAQEPVSEHALASPEPAGRERRRLRTAGRWAAEFLALFLAVTLSFLAEDLREDWSERREERVVLEAIRADLQADLPIVRSIVQYDSAAAAAARWLHRNWDRQALPSDSVAMALQPQYDARVYAPARAAYESAKGAGRFDFIEDAELRTAIGSHYETGQGEENAVNDLTITSLLELWRGLRPYVEFGSDFPPGCCVPTVSLAAPWSQLQQDRVLRNTLMTAQTFRSLSESRMRDFAAAISLLDQRIALELESRR